MSKNVRFLNSEAGSVGHVLQNTLNDHHEIDEIMVIYTTTGDSSVVWWYSEISKILALGLLEFLKQKLWEDES